MERADGVALGEERLEGTYGFLSGWYLLLKVRYAFLISLSEADFEIPSKS